MPQGQRWGKRSEHVCPRPLGLHHVLHVGLHRPGIGCGKEKAAVRLEGREDRLVQQKAGVRTLRSTLLVLPPAMRPVLSGVSVEPLKSPADSTGRQDPERDQRRTCPLWGMRAFYFCLPRSLKPCLSHSEKLKDLQRGKDM